MSRSFPILGALLLGALLTPAPALANPCSGFSGDDLRVCKGLLGETPDGQAFTRADRNTSQCSGATDGLPKAFCYAVGGDASKCKSLVPDYAADERNDICTAFDKVGDKVSALDAGDVSCSSISIGAAQKFCLAVAKPADSHCANANTAEKAACIKLAKFMEYVWKGKSVGKLVTEAASSGPGSAGPTSTVTSSDDGADLLARQAFLKRGTALVNLYEPLRMGLGNEDVREFYVTAVEAIDTDPPAMKSGPMSPADLADYRGKLEAKAYAACDKRLALKLEARELMRDRAKRQELDTDNPLLSCDHYFDKYMKRNAAKYSGDQLKDVAWMEMLGGSRRSNVDVNARYLNRDG